MDQYAKKRFGQNFLNDKSILNKIANSINIEDKNILEIGPGKGALTSLLIEKARQVVCFEIDFNLVDFLNENFKDVNNLEIINQDFLKSDLSNFNDYKIVANIPYNISTNILFKIFENYMFFDEVVLLVQKEFAQRIVATKGSKNYSKLAPTTKLFYESKILFDVDPKCFWPIPKVTSSVIYLKRTNVKHEVDYVLIMDFIKKCFSMRRKTLWNNIKNYYNISNQQFINICNHLNLDTNSRPENLELNDFINLFNEIKITSD